VPVSTISTPIGQRPFGSGSRALIGGVQSYMVDGPPLHSAIKRKGGGRGSQYEVHRAASHPTDILTLTRSKRRALSATESSTDAGNATPTSAPPPRTSPPSPPNRCAGERPQHRRPQWIGHLYFDHYVHGWSATSPVLPSLSLSSRLRIRFYVYTVNHDVLFPNMIKTYPI
jgi:hypothetical protein